MSADRDPGESLVNRVGEVRSGRSARVLRDGRKNIYGWFSAIAAYVGQSLTQCSIHQKQTAARQGKSTSNDIAQMLR
jgi:hypothetical protein